MFQTTFEELKLSGSLPSPAGVGMKILTLTRTEDYSAEEMGHAIMTDSSLTGRILKLANSAARGGFEPATTVSEAIMRLGSRTVRDLALAFSLVSERSAGTCRAYDYELYWARSLGRAVAAQSLSRILNIGKPEEAYICGLLGEVGMLALASVYPDKYADILETNGTENPDALLIEERSAFDIDHSQVGACMMSDWGLPESFAEAVGSFTSSRNISRSENQGEGMATQLRFAQILAEAMVVTKDSSLRSLDQLGRRIDELTENLEMNESAFNRFFDTCVKEWVAWGESLEVNTGEGVRLREVSELILHARERIANGETDEVAESKATEVASEQVAPSAMDEKAQETVAMDVGRFRILAVDDDANALDSLRSQLEDEGHDVYTARGGKEALRAAFKWSPDIVVSAWDMPDLNGLDLCRSLRRTSAGGSMYFLVMTELADEESMVSAFDAGVDDFVTTPAIERVLMARIRSGIRVAALQRKVESDKQTMYRQVAELGVMTRKLRATSLTDPLTELPNRRYAMKRLESDWENSSKTGSDFSVVMVDIDHFKSVNDNFGHDMGDLVLRATANLLKKAIRASDEVCRIGGEEFLILCKNTSESDCSKVAERVRLCVERNIVREPGFDRNVTLSLGVAGSDGGYPDTSELLKAADEAVYVAKDNGRNRVERASHMPAKTKGTQTPKADTGTRDAA